MALSEEAKKASALEGLHVNQSVLISGESGAGKTEACKRVLEFLTAASRRRKQQQADSGVGGGDKTQRRRRASQVLTAPLAVSNFGGGGGDARRGSTGTDTSVEVLLREASPVLEAFGNAKTIRNDNSSRFGKYVAVQYDASGIIIGASSETYLLERSRVVEISSGERNYHIFYQLLTDGALCDKWGLSSAEGMMYLSSEPPYVEVEEEERDPKTGKLTGGIKYTMVQEEGPRRVAVVAGASDSQEFNIVKKGLELFGMDNAELNTVWRVVCAVALLGNAVFEAKAGLDREVAVVKEEQSVVKAAACLGCGVEALRLPMVRKKVVVAGDAMDVEFTCKAAGQARDALSRVIYGTLFDVLVKRINEVSKGPEASNVIASRYFGFEVEDQLLRAGKEKNNKPPLSRRSLLPPCSDTSSSLPPSFASSTALHQLCQRDATGAVQ